ncbi:Lipopolysaccharide heptosyltransferase I [Candidatus Sulfopaludibacter sp. SbA3]|nr:Lipopolysaccharide heptosyltransferase I [Candidatus Sulfopaludibacter sp. SbA3]
MFIDGKGSTRILVVRLGAMGDILHALPAVASLKHSYRNARLTWVVKPQWAPLLEGNPFVDRILLLRRDFPGGLYRSWRDLRSEPYDFAVDFQGLLQSATLASAAHPDRVFGFHQSQLRERAAGIFYSVKTLSTSAHVVDRNLDLAAAAGAASLLHTFPLPPGSPEGQLPEGDFVLASPLAGWRSKQWPLEHYAALATRLRSQLGVPLVLNAPPGASYPQVPAALLHCSGLRGLIHATRRAAAVVGVDSGPLHMAAALAKPGVALFGPTDPARNGPYGGTLRVLRSPGAVTTYKRGSVIDESMRQIDPDTVFEALKTALGCLV